MSLAGQKVEQPSVVVPFFSPFGLKIGTLCLEIEILRNISKKKTNVIQEQSEVRENQSVRENQRYSENFR